MKVKPVAMLQPEEASPPAAKFEIVTDSLRSGWQEAQRIVSENSGPAARKAGEVSRAAIRTGMEVRRAVRDGGGDIGELIGGETGRQIGSYVATVGLGWVFCGLLPFDEDAEGLPFDDHVSGA